ncbi:ABC transporter permease [Novosphingobium sp. FSW06-99]|uniref:ABC transporter permease n=1 Tax=Novosphingobium sp. FSW06-99 TaxID=1739113 RepID=UPI000AFA594C|nr:ABC transporter permease subunit [Novosphingobium sp. FSW06-99]
MNEEIAFLTVTGLAIVRALPVTVVLALTSALGASAVAVALVAAQATRVGRPLAQVWIFVFRGTPLLLQMFMVYYGLAAVGPIRHGLLWPLFRDPLFCAFAAMTCCCSAYIAEVLRAAWQAIPPGQVEAAQACGMSRWTRVRRVIAPQMLRLALPAYGNELVMLIKSTSLASTITVLDVTGVAQTLIAHSYRTLEVFCLAAAVYLGLTAGLTALLRRIERNLERGTGR